MFGATFTDWPLLFAPSESWVCAGCVSILAGRPGDDPPPVRVSHILATTDGATYPTTPDLATILRDPPAGEFVLAVAESRQRHAALRAGVSTAELMIVGLDDVAAEVRRADIAVLDAVEVLLGALSRDEVLAGLAPATAILRLGPDRWAEAEALIAHHRPSPLLRLLVLAARRQDPAPCQESSMDQPLSERRAAELIALISEGSSQRGRDGLAFWKSILPHRLTRFASLDLRRMTSRLMEDLGTAPTSAGPVLALLDAIPEHEVADVETVVRTRSAIIVAYALRIVQERRAARTTEQT